MKTIPITQYRSLRVRSASLLLLCVAALLFLNACSQGASTAADFDPPPPSALQEVQLPIDTPAIPKAVVLEENEQVFEAEIAAFEEMEAESPSAKGGILFTGSSSIRKWETLEADMAPLTVVNRGFGGSTLRQVDAYADRFILPLAPKLLVLYCGENDIANDRYPAEAATEDFLHLLAYLRYHLPDMHLVYISMKPSPARWQYNEKFQEASRGIAQVCLEDPQLTYIDVGPLMLDADGQPDNSIFVRDKLHMNAKGYAIWTQAIRPVVMDLWEKLDQ